MEGPTALGDLLAAKRNTLVAEWKQRVVRTLAPEGSRGPELLEGLPPFIDALASELKSGGHVAASGASELAIRHGSQRFHAGFSVGAVIREYQVLEDCIFDLAERGGVAAVAALRVVSRRIGAAVAEATEEFTRERDAAINRERDLHLSFIAHELRNPLGSARLALESLKRQVAGAPPALHRVERGLLHIQRLIDQTVLDVRLKILSRGGELRLASLSLRDVINEVVADVADDALDKDIRLDAGDVDAIVIQADQMLIRSALNNLVRNAVKFTRNGETVTVRAHADEGRAAVSVEDRCGGLPEGRVEELFLPFVQKGGDRSGYGLGLAIARQAVEAHHGTIQVRNLPRQGCIFSFDVPVEQPGAPGSAAEAGKDC